MRLFLALLLLLPGVARAGDFGVSPIRIELDRSARSAVLTVSNDDKRRLGFQVRALKWSQDESGQDRYDETDELVYFPQQLEVPAGESRIIRLGYRTPPQAAERTYRLFVEEMAEPAPGAAPRTGVAITLRFGVPVFVRPPVAQLKGELELDASGGQGEALVRNTGNVHFRISSVRLTGVDASGAATFEQSVDGWYVLAGANRPHRVKIPPAACAATRALRAEALAEGLVLRAEQPLKADACR